MVDRLWRSGAGTLHDNGNCVGSDKKVLVLFEALSRLLRASEFSVESFPSGQEFLDSLEERHPDRVVLDLQMPQTNGLDVLKELRSRGVDVPVIVITAHDEAIVRANYLAAGASAYLCSPTDEVVLRRAITDAIH